MLLAAIIVAAGSFSLRNLGKNESKDISLNEGIAKHDFLHPAYMDPASYDGLFDNLTETDPKNNIIGAVAPHHFLAKNKIARLYGQIKNENTELVYLISPDHFTNFFDIGKIAYTSNLPWQTPFGDIFAAEISISKLIDTGRVATRDNAVGLEHGITVETPFIKYFFSNAKIVPLVLKNSSNYSDFFDLGQKIKEISRGRSIMIVSSDFCHNLPAAAARSADQKSIVALKNLNISGLGAVNNDCRQCLALLAGYLDGKNYDFTLVDNTNSFEISSQDPDFVTSYVSGYYFNDSAR